MNYKYSEKEISTLLKSLIILSDTRERENRHILQPLHEKGMEFLEIKLDAGDYSYMLPKNEKLGIVRDTYFDNDIVIERKASLEELSGNLTKDRTRFEAELIRCKGKMILMIEGNSYTDIFYHSYKTKFNENAFFASLISYRAKYGIDIAFIDQVFSWKYIYATCYYHLKNYLKRG